jgi:hypothetical protein
MRDRSAATGGPRWTRGRAAGSTKTRGTPKLVTALDRLEPEAAKSLLRRLLAAHAPLEWVPDFPTEAATHAVSALTGRETKRGVKTTHGSAKFGEEFFDRHVPEWSDLIARAFEGE